MEGIVLLYGTTVVWLKQALETSCILSAFIGTVRNTRLTVRNPLTRVCSCLDLQTLASFEAIPNTWKIERPPPGKGRAPFCVSEASRWPPLSSPIELLSRKNRENGVSQFWNRKNVNLWIISWSTSLSDIFLFIRSGIYSFEFMLSRFFNIVFKCPIRHPTSPSNTRMG